jgi:hypothetical protein
MSLQEIWITLPDFENGRAETQTDSIGIAMGVYECIDYSLAKWINRYILFAFLDCQTSGGQFQARESRDFNELNIHLINAVQ